MDPQQENNGFGPIPKTRGKRALVAGVIGAVFSAFFHIKATLMAPASEEEESKDKVLFVIFGTALLILSLMVGEIVQRICLLFEEMKHRETRYGGSWMKIFKSTFAFTSGRTILFLFVASLLVVFYALYQNFNTIYRSEYAILFSLNCFLVPLLCFIVGFRELSSVEVSENNERGNKNVADGLAWCYYYGYLKLVLPKLRDQICQSMEFRHKILKKKLFILLPKNCYTYGTIEEADPRVKCADNLKPYEIHRGGILRRSYMHTVYRIEMLRPDGEIDEYHVVLEYPAILMSLYDMSANGEAGLSRQQRDEQVVLFMRKLKEILDTCKDCKGKYELVLISGEHNNIADVLVPKLCDADLQMD